MDDALAMRGVEAAGDLQGDLERLADGQRAAGIEPLAGRAAGHVLGNDEQLAPTSSRACTAATFGCTSAAAARASS